jgi:hypothetical protein
LNQCIDDELTIRGRLTRKEIRDRVVLKFLEEQPGTKYRYLVETLSDSRKMFLLRPTRRFDFDFKIEVENWHLRGTHEEILTDLKRKRRNNPRDFPKLMQVIRAIHTGDDVDQTLLVYKEARFPGIETELLLKLLKWMFILEDIYYWNYKGRDKLMEFLESSLGQSELTAEK